MIKSSLGFFLTVCLVQGLANLNAADIILNEYNAVSGSRKLDAGMGADSFFGTIDGNGGNWFELLVIEDHVDMRGWKMHWEEDEAIGEGDETAAGTLTLSNDPLWSDLRTGSIITFIETVNGGAAGNPNTATDVSYDPLNGDWWINLSTQGEAAKASGAFVTTTTNDGLPGDFSVGKDDWFLTLVNANDEVIFGPAGEGAGNWAGDGVGSEEGAALEGPVGTDQDPVTIDTWKAITPSNEFYDDTGSTSFGAANADYDDVDKVFINIQDLSILRDQVMVTPLKSGDFDNDGELTAGDINALTAAVGNPAADEKFDVNSDANVDAEDRRLWIEEIKNTYIGDSNLDGEFSSTDLVFVFQKNEYEDGIANNSKWETGDWDGDQEFTTTDFVFAFQANGYEMGLRNVQAVPEPSSMLMLFAAGILLLRRRN